eukprot:COSAG02_NODE_234_length_27784_cov_12.556872_19_plen_71_part_00
MPFQAQATVESRPICVAAVVLGESGRGGGRDWNWPIWTIPSKSSRDGSGPKGDRKCEYHLSMKMRLLVSA